MPHLRGTVYGARGPCHATLASTRRRATVISDARACPSYAQVAPCKPPPVRGCGRRARTCYIKWTLMLKLCAGYSISPYAACHLNGHARVRNTAWIIIKASVNGINGASSAPPCRSPLQPCRGSSAQAMGAPVRVALGTLQRAHHNVACTGCSA